ncbi:MAG: glycosyltransferase family 39 protein, partial [bacterium]
MRARLLPGLTVAAVVFSVLSAGVSAWQQDLTTDEPIHLEWSRRLLETRVSDRGALHFNSKTPVMIPNVLARKAVRRFADTKDVRLLTFAARLPTLLWHLALLLAVFFLTRSFVGRSAAHLATLGAALEPNLVANASIATVDAAYALFTVLTLGAVLAFARRPSLVRALLVGLALGDAFSTKFTAFLLIPGVLLF